MDLRQLRILTAVAEVGSFTAAAERLYLTQSAVSQQMARLEREVGRPLFARGPRGVALTEVGRDVASGAAEVLAKMDEFELAVGALSDARSRLRIGAFSSAGVELLPRTVRRFRADHPDVDVAIRTMNPADPLEPLLSGSLDVLLVFDYSVDPRDFGTSVDRLHLLDDPFHVLLPLEHRLAGADELDLIELADAEWIFQRHSPPHQEIYERACHQAGFTPDVVFYADDFRTLQGLVAVGMGVSIAPLGASSPGRSDVASVAVRTPDLVRRISVLTLPSSQRDGAVTGFVEALRSTAAGAPGA
ncbi:LysR family transcriptional regulator [Nocardioides humi]|uniref:LysR family transcriptional regulator n=1 Tax=Nocardioides humi TaxID=449461 RepID=A0ABN2A848_9ACTN|nr:LysR family transcriptional regulator [Nocardioides humi]